MSSSAASSGTAEAEAGPEPAKNSSSLGGIPPQLKAHVLDYLPNETVEVALPMLVDASKRDRGKSTISNTGTRRARATFQNVVCGKCSFQKSRQR